MTFIPPSLRGSKSGLGLRQQTTLMPRRANTHPGHTRPKVTSVCLSKLIFRPQFAHSYPQPTDSTVASHQDLTSLIRAE